jgi:hypothetical protein
MAALALELAACGKGTLTQGATEDAGHDGGPLPCGESIAEWCAASAAIPRDACDMTWQAALADQSQCDTNLSLYRVECGAYNLDWRAYVDTGNRYYYDAASGALVAIVETGDAPGALGCVAGPSTGFSPPVCPQGPNLCEADGGTADAAVDHTADAGQDGGPLPCGESVAEGCASIAASADDARYACDMTWQAAQADRGQCDYGSFLAIYLEDCGGYNVDWRAGVDTGLEYFYDPASGALVAVIDPVARLGAGACAAGPSTGFSPPQCPRGPNFCAADGGTDAAVDHTTD